MKRVQYFIHINAPKEKVYDCMLGLSDKSTYEKWTAIFNPMSTYRGAWSPGSKMLFIGSDEHGEQGGMVSEIVEAVPGELVTIRHYGLYKSGEEITEGPEVAQWAGGIEQYVFNDDGQSTALTINLDTAEDFVAYMDEKFPAALQVLKQHCEQ